MVPSRRRGWPHRRPRLDPRSRVGTDGTDQPSRLNSTFVEVGIIVNGGGIETEGVYPEDRPGLAGERVGDVVEQRREKDVAEVAMAFHPTSPFFRREHAMAHRGGSMPPTSEVGSMAHGWWRGPSSTSPRGVGPWHGPTTSHPPIDALLDVPRSFPHPPLRLVGTIHAAMPVVRPSPPSHQVHPEPAPVAPFLHVHLGLVSRNTIVNPRWRRSFERRKQGGSIG